MPYKSPLMTIVIPCHGRINLLRMTIESVANQSSREFAVIVSDDSAAEAESEAIVRMCAEVLGAANVKYHYIFTERTLGQVGNTNQGLRAAEGEYVRILHSDDVLHPNAIEYELHSFKGFGSQVSCIFHENLAFVEGGIDFDFSTGPSVTVCSYADVVLGRLHSSTPFPSGIAIRRTLLEQAGYMDESYKRACDWEWFYRIVKHAEAQSSKLLSVSAKYIGYRVHDDSNTENPATRFLNFLEYERIAASIERDLILLKYEPNAVNDFANKAKTYRYERLLRELKELYEDDQIQYRELIWKIISNKEDLYLFQ